MAAGLIAVALCGRAFAGASESTRFLSAGVPYVFSFPRDHGSHPMYQTEWWYYTGHLGARDGRRFGYELTFFRIGLLPGDPAPAPGRSRWRGHELIPAHFAITDESGNRFVHAQRMEREALGQGSASTQRLSVRSGDWTLTGAASGDPAIERMTLHAGEAFEEGRAALDLVQVPAKKPAIHGHDGISRKGACTTCASHYYSYTRLRTSGTLTYRGEALAVSGVSWMDHEFGSAELEPDQTGWDWFALQLDDGRELMLYVLRRAGGGVTPQSSGSLIGRDGSVTYLKLGDYSAQASGSWESPHTKAVYPSGWRVTVPSAKIDLTLAPTVLDQELADAGGISYWEGSVAVRDARSGKPLGLGYVELTGYAGHVSF